MPINCLNLAFLIYFGLLSVNAQGTHCKTPDNKDGNCIPVSTCQPIRQFLTFMPTPSAYQRTKLAQYQCKFNGLPIRACCPNNPIEIPVSESAERHIHKLEVRNNVNLLPTDCGTAKNSYRILNGQLAGLFQFPWMALLSYQTKSGPQFKCGGSVINERHVLTAAHCITPQLLGVRVGEHNISSKLDCEEEDGELTCAPAVQDLRFDQKIVHPNYDNPLNGYDIALIRLATPIKFVENVKPICLPITEEVINAELVGKKLTVTGFGITENLTSSNVMLFTKLLVTPEEKCQSQYQKQNIHVDNKQICAGDSRGSDSCNGDSGGPLQGIKFDGNNQDIARARVYQYGIVSIGPRPCANIEYPGIYTKVSSYMKWILDNIKP